MFRYHIINHFINKFGYKNYLEIGVARKSFCFDHVNIDKKTSVDPGYGVPDEIYDYKMESDLFFKSLHEGRTEFSADHKWDIIFIDGLHLAEQVEIDVLNALEHLSPNGTILMHDCSPPSELIAREDSKSWPYIDEWCGTVWKAFYKLRQTRTDLEMTCVDTDWGVGIIRRGKQKLAPADNPYYSFFKFNDNRKEYLNLITVDEFIQKF